MVRIVVIVFVALGVLALPGALRAQDHDHGNDRHLAGDGHHGGFPEFVDVFFTHHAYLERKLHLRFDTTVENEANEFEESAELAWQFNRWFGSEVEVPLIQTDPDDGDGSSGIGDIEVAPIVSFYQNPGSMTILSVRSGFVLPTGDEEEGLGVDGWIWEPGFLLWQAYGESRRGAIQAELTYERFYASEDEDEEELLYNIAWSHWLPSNWIPIAEINGVTRLGEEHEEDEEELAGLNLASGGAESEDDTLISATLGFRYAFANGQQWGAGVQFPISDSEAYDYRLVIGGIIHFN
jgi:hypothetical protein